MSYSQDFFELSRATANKHSFLVGSSITILRYFCLLLRHQYKVVLSSQKPGCDCDWLSFVPTSDVSDVSGIVSGIGIARTLRSSGNQNDVSDGSRSVVGRKRKPSDPSDSDSVALPIPIATRFFDLH